MTRAERRSRTLALMRATVERQRLEIVRLRAEVARLLAWTPDPFAGEPLEALGLPVVESEACPPGKVLVVSERIPNETREQWARRLGILSIDDGPLFHRG
jgi:hypothetical protein